LGVRLVTDKWLVDSSRKKKFQDPEQYIPKAPKQEKEWGFSLREVWGKPHQFLKDHTVYFTSALVKTFQDFSEIQQLVRHAGAKKVVRSGRYAGSAKPGDKVVVLGLEEDDVECAALLKGGCTVYNRDIVAASILRGSIELDSDEFKINPGGASSPKRGASPKVTPTPRKRGRPRKS
jgi:hypothetical protein